MSEKMTEIMTIITNMTNITHITDTTPTKKTRATTSAQACLLLARQAEQTVMLPKTGAGSFSRGGFLVSQHGKRAHR